MKVFFRKIHLWLSIPLGMIISVICLSGAALVFEKDITERLNPSLYRVECPDGGVPLQLSELVRRVRMQTSDSMVISSVLLSSNPVETCMFSIKGAGKRRLSVNPYTGKVNGWTESPAFFQTIRKLHRWLMNPPLRKGVKSAGKVIVGVTTLLMIVILVTGLIVWIPRSRKALKNRLAINCRKGMRRFWYDSHVSLGFYSTFFLLLMALTGLTWSFGWYRTMAYRLLGTSAAPQATSVHGNHLQSKESGKKDSADFDYMIWDKVLSQLQVQNSGYSTIALEKRQAQINMPGNFRRTNVVTFSPKSGEIIGIVPHSEILQSQKVKGWMYAFHTGSWGGTITKVLYFIAALIGGVLPLSGYYLWWKRISRKR